MFADTREFTEALFRILTMVSEPTALLMLGVTLIGLSAGLRARVAGTAPVCALQPALQPSRVSKPLSSPLVTQSQS